MLTIKAAHRQSEPKAKAATTTNIPPSLFLFSIRVGISSNLIPFPMEDETSNVSESEEVSEAFLCCVCLDLLYKPIVLSCGHISCFWCVHRSMNSRRESHCPICRHPYNHFPVICQMLHFLILKMYPAVYKRREKQILEEEEGSGYFSPQLNAPACASHANKELVLLDHYAHFSALGFEFNLSLDTWPARKEETDANIKQLESVSASQINGATIPKETSGENCNEIITAAAEGKNYAKNLLNKTCKWVSIPDVLCTACKQLLFQPVVLNCGHVYCTTCIPSPADKILRCQVCQSPHPNGFPKVCLELHHFLEEQFPKEYKMRRDAVQLKQFEIKHGNPATCSTEAGSGFNFSTLPTEKHLTLRTDYRGNVHIGAGCDSCGIYPIIGDRYRCKDCVEEVGFDLCGDCYNTCSKLPGRFNQQHTPEHKFELVKPNMFHSITRLFTGQLADGSTTFLISDSASGIPETILIEDDSAAQVMSNVSSESPENGSLAALTLSSDAED